MNAMKKFVLGALICVNLALVVAVVFHARPEKAYAQRGRGGSYTMLTARRNSNEDVVYVIDTSRQLMVGWLLEKARNGDVRLIAIGPRDLAQDFPLARR